MKKKKKKNFFIYNIFTNPYEKKSKLVKYTKTILKKEMLLSLKQKYYKTCSVFLNE
ncbi:hypothetical protein Hanom_Chr11g00972621 [Helianthus anomalus]